MTIVVDPIVSVQSDQTSNNSDDKNEIEKCEKETLPPQSTTSPKIDLIKSLACKAETPKYSFVSSLKGQSIKKSKQPRFYPLPPSDATSKQSESARILHNSDIHTSVNVSDSVSASNDNDQLQPQQQQEQQQKQLPKIAKKTSGKPSMRRTTSDVTAKQKMTPKLGGKGVKKKQKTKAIGMKKTKRSKTVASSGKMPRGKSNRSVQQQQQKGSAQKVSSKR